MTRRVSQAERDEAAAYARVALSMLHARACCGNVALCGTESGAAFRALPRANVNAATFARIAHQVNELFAAIEREARKDALVRDKIARGETLPAEGPLVPDAAVGGGA